MLVTKVELHVMVGNDTTGFTDHQKNFYKVLYLECYNSASCKYKIFSAIFTSFFYHLFKLKGRISATSN